MTAEQWNKRYQVGMDVAYIPIIGEESYVLTKTKSSAWELAPGQAVVMIEATAYCVSLDNLVTDDDLNPYQESNDESL